ncbi:hypothetical protein EIP86_000548 [Pleurotus ostreatoroseus]|nr:hypothetical protein EIP86_000548 [Pleurotus ostreatoroseus]
MSDTIESGTTAAVHLKGANGTKSDGSSGTSLSDEYYKSRLSNMAKNRPREGIRACLHLERTPGIISLLAGKPHTSTFPFTDLKFTFRDPSDPESELPVELTPAELQEGLQYGPTTGVPALVDWLYGLQEKAHGRSKNEGWQLSVGNGSQDLIYKAVTALINPGDVVLMEAPVYAGVIPVFSSLHCEIIEVETDAHGIKTDSLRAIYENWPESKPKPKVLYTIPYGSNPTGATATLERRLEVLALAREHEFFILEGKTYNQPGMQNDLPSSFPDDPYHFLYYGPSPRPSSYFSLDRDQPQRGWVVRFDSLSKVLSSGIRIGFVSGPETIVQAMDDHTMTANLQPNSLSQILALALLKRWGYDGFFGHTTRVAEFYRKKRDVFQEAMLRHLSDVAEWSVPEAGMFMWFRLLVDADGNADEGDSNEVIRTTALECGVLALPGTMFYPNGRKTAYVRASFSQLEPQDVDEALRRLRKAILDSRQS